MGFKEKRTTSLNIAKSRRRSSSSNKKPHIFTCGNGRSLIVALDGVLTTTCRGWFVYSYKCFVFYLPAGRPLLTTRYGYNFYVFRPNRLCFRVIPELLRGLWISQDLHEKTNDRLEFIIIFFLTCFRETIRAQINPSTFFLCARFMYLRTIFGDLFILIFFFSRRVASSLLDYGQDVFVETLLRINRRSHDVQILNTSLQVHYCLHVCMSRLYFSKTLSAKSY